MARSPASLPVPVRGRRREGWRGQETIAKLTKLVHVYDFENKNLIGSYSTVKCAKKFRMGKDTLTKHIKNGQPYKNKLFSRALRLIFFRLGAKA
jgi:hypothetical protein